MIARSDWMGAERAGAGSLASGGAARALLRAVAELEAVLPASAQVALRERRVPLAEVLAGLRQLGCRIGEPEGTAQPRGGLRRKGRESLR